MPSKVADRVFPQALNFKTDSAISYTKFSLEIVLEASLCIALYFGLLIILNPSALLHYSASSSRASLGSTRAMATPAYDLVSKLNQPLPRNNAVRTRHSSTAETFPHL